MELMNCVNEAYSASVESFYGIKNEVSFYDLMLEVEKVLIDDKLLKNTKKNSFIDFFSKLKESDKKLALEKINKLLEESKFEMNYNNLYSIFQLCPYKLLVKNKNIDSDLLEQHQIFGEMELKGNDDLILLHKVIETTEDKILKNSLSSANNFISCNKYELFS
ncbi:hypothetical protein [Tenacibaculum litopenaei]|uniref:hypothetical protein n=1 Tax=Tenacibaculum litopenaei TaxID=396016 RepID=UPI0038B41D1A